MFKSALKEELANKIGEDLIIQAETDGNKLAEDILSKVKTVEELFQVESPKEDDVFVMLIFKCTKEFHEKYESVSSTDYAQGIQLTNQVTEAAKADHDEQQFNNENPQTASKKAQDNNVEVFVDQDDNEVQEEEKLLKSRKKFSHPKADTENYSDIVKILEENERYFTYISKAFEKLEFGTDDLLDIIIKKFCIKKELDLKKEDPSIYEKGKRYQRRTYPNVSEDLLHFFRIQFDDFLFLITAVISFYTGVSIKLELGDIKTNVMMIIFAETEKQFNKLALMFSYELQLKPYAYTYELYRREFKKVKDQKSRFLETYGSWEEGKKDSGMLLKQKISTPVLQYEELSIQQPYLWPPYRDYEVNKEGKYRRYTKDDLFHECENEENEFRSCGKCSKFRNIDKLRLLYDSVDKCLKITYLKRKEFIISILYKRNYVSYGEKLSVKHLLSHCWNIFSKRNFKYLSNLIRNFYGEVLCFYFLWMEHYIQWLFFPSILGLIIGVFVYVDPFSSKPLGKSSITKIDLLLLSFSAIIIVWATLFLKVWSQKETLYSYFWGTEKYLRNDPDSELFNPNSETEFVFGEKITQYSSVIRKFKKAISYFTLIVMVVATCSLTFLLFHYKKKQLKEDTPANYWYNTAVGVGFASINAIQIKIFNFIYTFLAGKLNKWENYKKDYQRLNDLSIKIIIFDFMNSYFACFYIGFYKPAVGEECVGTCIQEIGTQLYTTLAINFGLDFVEIGLPFAMYMYRAWSFKKKTEANIDILKIQPHSVLHQMLCDEYINTIYDYNEMVILFGYVCLFSVTAPFTPIIVLILVFTEKIFDLVKLFFLQKVQILEEASGIEIYNKILKVIMFIGMLTNTGVIIFSKEFKVNNSAVYNLSIFFGVENVILIIMYFINWDIIPTWFKEGINELKELYDKKYFRRGNKFLPHNTLRLMSEAYQKKNE